MVHFMLGTGMRGRWGTNGQRRPHLSFPHLCQDQASAAPPDSSGQGGQQRPCREAGAVEVVTGPRLLLVLSPQLLLLLLL